MDELVEAIEDAQYVNAIATQDYGPKPVTAWLKPSPEELQEWQQKKRATANIGDSATPLSLEWFLQQEIGLFLFSTFLKDSEREFCRINFCEEVYRFRKSGRRRSVERARVLLKHFFTAPTADDESGKTISPNTSQIKAYATEIYEFDLLRNTSIPSVLPPDELAKAISDFMDFPVCSECPLGLKGIYRESVVRKMEQLEMQIQNKMNAQEAPNDNENGTEDELKKKPNGSIRQVISAVVIDKEMFDHAECIVIESLKRDYWEKFQASPQYERLLNFLWYQDRRVVPEDFFVMRVLGRGGFGLVNACKKGTSGKLYAQKVINKKRIKIKKSEQLAVNERNALAAIESIFVVNLKYSFHSKDDVYLILDLMTGGDLSYHLSRGRFTKSQCLYYAARIMFALQALHDRGYVYRDLKPENCLLDDEGRVRITDLGLTTKITPKLYGAAGTRGYWAPEMLRRDSKGKRMVYGHCVDWFSFGCCLAEFVSGTNPFRTEAALKFGREAGHESKEKAIDHATLEMTPAFPPEKFDSDVSDLCVKLLDKNEKTRLGYNGCKEIMPHPWFAKGFARERWDWENILADRVRPPFVPYKGDTNVESQGNIGSFPEDKVFQSTVITEKDEEIYKDWDWTNPRAYAAEVLEYLIHERKTGAPIIPILQEESCCCSIL